MPVGLMAILVLALFQIVFIFGLVLLILMSESRALFNFVL